MSPVIPGSINNLIFGFANPRDVTVVTYIVGSIIGISPQLAFYVYMGTLVQSIAEMMEGNMKSSPLYLALFVLGLILTAAIFVYMSKQATAILLEEKDEDSSESPSTEMTEIA